MRTRALALTCLLAIVISLGVTFTVHAVRSASRVQDPLALLDLSSAQRRAIGERFREFHPRLLERQSAVDRARARLASLLVARSSEEDPDVRSCLEEIAHGEAELDREVARSLVLLKPHLTPAQQTTLFQYIELRHSGTDTAR